MPIVIAHRGASAYEPENSLAAFRRAVALGADGIELDVHETADAALVVRHDGDLDGQPLQRLSAAAVRAHRLPNGEPTPTLQEALRAIGADTTAFIEIKTLRSTADDELFAAIDGAPAPANCHVHSFDHRVIRRLGTGRPDLPTGVLAVAYPLDPVAPVAASGAGALWQHEELIDEGLVAAAHAHGAWVYAWTVDAPERMRALLEMGVDGICTNAPDVAREVVG